MEKRITCVGKSFPVGRFNGAPKRDASITSSARKLTMISVTNGRGRHTEFVYLAPGDDGKVRISISQLPGDCQRGECIGIGR